MPPYRSVVITTEFLASLTTLAPTDQRRILRALVLLDEDEGHASLRVHQLTGGLAGKWSASASRSLRITFVRLPGGRKQLADASHHYGD